MTTASKEYKVPGLVGFAIDGEPAPTIEAGYYDMYHTFDTRGEGVMVKFEVPSEGVLKLSLDDWRAWLEEIGVRIEVWLDRAFESVVINQYHGLWSDEDDSSSGCELSYMTISKGKK